jgi:hypothetical protein
LILASYQRFEKKFMKVKDMMPEQIAALRQELIARSEAYHNSLRGKIVRWTLFGLIALGVVGWTLRLSLDPSIRHMPSTTTILNLCGGALMITSVVYRSGGWRAWWNYFFSSEFQPDNYYALGMGQRPAAWTHALFWLGAGLFALALWRQWSGV